MAFRAWCREKPENERDYDKFCELLGALRDSSNAPEIRALREWALDEQPKPWHRRWSVRVGLATAAVAVLATGLWLVQPGSIMQTPLQVEPETAYTTAVGERSTANLDDGSVAELNTNTRLNIDFSDNERRVELVEGQVFFDVAKDPDRPFVVIAGDQRIEAIGTAFDVLHMNGQVKVTLVEGIVNVAAQTSNEAEKVDDLFVQLEAGQSLVTAAVAPVEPPRIELTNTDLSTVWRSGRAFFEDSSLSEAIEEMNRYSRVQIRLEGEGLEHIRMNGMFRTGQQDNFVDTLVAYYAIEAEHLGDNVIVLKSR
jgi:transmembrane sensor